MSSGDKTYQGGQGRGGRGGGRGGRGGGRGGFSGRGGNSASRGGGYAPQQVGHPSHSQQPQRSAAYNIQRTRSTPINDAEQAKSASSHYDPRRMQQQGAQFQPPFGAPPRPVQHGGQGQHPYLLQPNQQQMTLQQQQQRQQQQQQHGRPISRSTGSLSSQSQLKQGQPPKSTSQGGLPLGGVSEPAPLSNVPHKDHIKMDNGEVLRSSAPSLAQQRSMMQFAPAYGHSLPPFQFPKAYPGRLPQTVPRSHQMRQQQGMPLSIAQQQQMRMQMAQAQQSVASNGYGNVFVPNPNAMGGRPQPQLPKQQVPKKAVAAVKRTPLAIMDDEGVELDRTEIESEMKKRKKEEERKEFLKKRIQPTPVYTGPPASALTTSSSTPSIDGGALTPSQGLSPRSGRSSRAVSDAGGRPALQHPPTQQQKQILRIETPPTSPNGVAYKPKQQIQQTLHESLQQSLQQNAPAPLKTGLRDLQPRTRADSSTKTPFSTPVAKGLAGDYTSHFNKMVDEAVLTTVEEQPSSAADRIASERSLLASTDNATLASSSSIPMPDGQGKAAPQSESETVSASNSADVSPGVEMPAPEPVPEPVKVEEESPLVKEMRANKEYGRQDDGTYAYAVALLRAYRDANKGLPSPFPKVPDGLKPGRAGPPPGMGGAPPGMDRRDRYEQHGGRGDRHGGGRDRHGGGYQQQHHGGNDRRGGNRDRGGNSRYDNRGGNNRDRGYGNNNGRNNTNQYGGSSARGFDSMIPHEKLVKGASAWVTGQGEESEYAKNRKKIVLILNKLTVEKFDTLSKQLLVLVQHQLAYIDQEAENSEKEIDVGTVREQWTQEVVQKIYEKALLDQHFAPIYAQLCKMLHDELSKDEKKHKSSFKRQLILQCQEEFEHASGRDEDLEGKTELEKKQIEKKIKSRKLGNIKFIGELFKQNLLKARLMFFCMEFLFGAAFLLGDPAASLPDEDDLDSLCSLLATVGNKLERSMVKKGETRTPMAQMNDIFKAISRCGRSDSGLPARTRFLCMDTIELRRNKWVPRRKKVVAKTLKEIRDEHARASQQAGKGQSRSSQGPRRDNNNNSGYGGGGGGRGGQMGGGRPQQKRQPKRDRYGGFSGSSSSGDVRGQMGGRSGSSGSIHNRNSSQGNNKPQSSSSFQSQQNNSSSSRSNGPLLGNKGNSLLPNRSPSHTPPSASAENSPQPAEELFPGELGGAETKRQKTIKSFLTEFKVHSLFKEFKADVADLGGAELHKEIVREMMLFFAEKADMRQPVITLSTRTIEESVFSPSAFVDGVKSMMYLLPDAVEDNPNAGYNIGELFAHWFESSIASPEAVFSVLKADEFAVTGKFSHGGKMIQRAVETTAKVFGKEKADSLLGKAKAVLPAVVTADFESRIKWP